MGLFDRSRASLRDTARGERVRELLLAYPAYSVPHPGATRLLSKAACIENLEYLLANRESRLGLLTNLLSGFRVDLGPTLDRTSDPSTAFSAMDRWLRAELPSAPKNVGGFDRFLESTRSGQNTIYSLLTDFGIVEGESIVRRRPDYQWALDTDLANRDMFSYRRPVLVGKPIGKFPAMVFDFEDIMYGMWMSLDTLPLASGKYGYTALSVIKGGYDPV